MWHILTHLAYAYTNLFCFLFSAQCLSMIFAILLPSVSVSLYFYANSSESLHGAAKQIDNENGIAHVMDKPNVSCHVSSVHANGNVPDNHLPTINCDVQNVEKPNPEISNAMKLPKLSLSNAIHRIGRHIKISYSNTTVIQWSILWAMSMCGFLQVRSIIHFSMIFFFFIHFGEM